MNEEDFHEKFVEKYQSFGSYLKHCRLSKKRSAKQIAEELFLQENLILQLEEDDFECLPAKIYSLAHVSELLECLVDDEEERTFAISFFEEAFNAFTERKKKEETSFLYTETPNEGEESNPNNDTSLEANLGTSSSSPSSIHEEEDDDDDTTGSQRKLFLEPVSLAVWFVSLSFVFLFLALFLWIFLLGEKGSYLDSTDVQSFTQQQKIFTLYGKLDIFEMRQGDELRVFIGNSLYALRLLEMGAEQLRFQENLYNKQFTAKLWERSYLKLTPDIGAENLSLQLGNDRNSDLLLKYQKQSGDIAVVYVENLSFENSVLDYDVIWEKSSHVLVAKDHVLLENQNKGPINVYVKAIQLPVHVSYNLDGKRQNSVNLSIGSDINISAQNHLEIQVGNYKSAAFIVNGIPVSMNVEGYNRYSVTKIIKWLASFENETLYDLTIKDYIN